MCRFYTRANANYNDLQNIEFIIRTQHKMFEKDDKICGEREIPVTLFCLRSIDVFIESS